MFEIVLGSGKVINRQHYWYDLAAKTCRKQDRRSVYLITYRFVEYTVRNQSHTVTKETCYRLFIKCLALVDASPMIFLLLIFQMFFFGKNTLSFLIWKIKQTDNYISRYVHCYINYFVSWQLDNSIQFKVDGLIMEVL